MLKTSFSKKEYWNSWDQACENRSKKSVVFKLMRTTKVENLFFSFGKKLIARIVFVSPVFFFWIRIEAILTHGLKEPK